MEFLRAGFATALVLTAPIGFGQAPAKPSGGAYDDLSLEDLMKIKVVTAGKKATTLEDLAAATTVITREDILRSGYKNVPDLLRMVPGVQVRQVTSSRWAITIRGFNSEFADRLLVMVDGRSVFTPFYNGVFWDDQDLLLEDVERIEVVRGPGGSLWGSNAVNGVINIITRSSHDTIGTYLEAGLGTYEMANLAYRYGATLGPNTSYRVYAKSKSVDSLALENHAGNEDSWHARRYGFRYDTGRDGGKQWLIEGDAGSSVRNEPFTIVDLTAPYYHFSIHNDAGTSASLLARHTSPDSKGTTSYQGSFSRTNREMPELWEARDTVVLSAQRQSTWNRHELVIGADWSSSSDRTASSYLQMDPADRTLQSYSVLFQDDWTLSDRTHLIFGTKALNQSYNGWENQPTVRLSHKPTQASTLWLAASKTVRTPSRLDRDANGTQYVQEYNGDIYEIRGISNPFESERTNSYELGYRIQPSKKLSIDGTVFHNEFDKLLTAMYLDPYWSTTPYTHVIWPYTSLNGGWGQTSGLELSVRYQPSDRLKLDINYSWFSSRMRALPGNNIDDGSNTSTPHHAVNFRVAYDFLPQWGLVSSLNYADVIPTSDLPLTYRYDLAVSYRESKNVEFQLTGQNLLAPDRKESYTYFNDRAGATRRSVGLMLKIRY